MRGEVNARVYIYCGWICCETKKKNAMMNLEKSNLNLYGYKYANMWII